MDETVLFSVNEYPTDGVQVNFEVSFAGGYISREHVVVRYFDAANVISEPAFTWVDDFEINVVPAPAAAGRLRIYRVTPADLPLVDFSDGSVVNEATLDLNAKQAVFLAAEVRDVVSTAPGLDDILASGAVALAAQAAAEDARDDAEAAAAAAEGEVDALRDDLADPTGATLVSTTGGQLQTVLDGLASGLAGKAPISTKSASIGANLYPVDFRLGRDHVPHPFEFIPANQHAAIIAGSTSYDASTDLQAMLDGWTPNQGKAGVIEFPVGVFGLAKKILFPNWLSWRGQGRGTQLLALSGHTGPYMFQFDSDPTKVLPSPQSRFNQRLEAFDINARMDIAGREALTNIIYAPSWNEKCGLRDVMARNVGCNFLLIDEWHGGSSGFGIEDLEVFMTPASADAGAIGLHFKGVSRAGTPITNRPQVTMRNCSIIGGKAGTDDATPQNVLITVDNIHLQLLGGIHFEKGKVGIDVQRNAMLTGFGLTGSDVGGKVATLVYRSGNHTGRVKLDDVYIGSGGTKALHDAVSGIHRTTPILGSLTVPSLPGEAWASGRFKVSGGAISGTPELQGCTAVIRAWATGVYKIPHSDAFGSEDQYYVVAAAHDENVRLRVDSWISERVGVSVNIRCYRTTDNTLFDPQQVTFRIYKRPGL